MSARDLETLMPLQDHFHLPWSEQNPWEGFHSAWINTIVRRLNADVLPRRYRAFPQVHLGRMGEWNDAYEARILSGKHLVAAVELVSPGNKDRPEHRQAFVTKCAAYLQEQVNLVVVDVVTARRANMHRELLALLGQANGDIGDLYCVSYRNRREQRKWRLDFQPRTLVVQQALPTVPLWLAENLNVSLDLESTYQETCQVLRIELAANSA